MCRMSTEQYRYFRMNRMKLGRRRRMLTLLCPPECSPALAPSQDDTGGALWCLCWGPERPGGEGSGLLWGVVQKKEQEHTRTILGIKIEKFPHP